MREHVIRMQDTPERLSAMYAVPICMIMKANPNIRAIKTGERIQIPPLDFCTKGDKKAIAIATHIVGVGESLLSICGNYNTTSYLVLAENKLEVENVVEGMELKIPILKDDFTVYRAKMGDTARSIAKAFSMRTEELLRLNDIEKDTDIYLGRQLILRKK